MFTISGARNIVHYVKELAIVSLNQSFAAFEGKWV